MARGWESEIQFQPSLLLPLINVRGGEIYTADSGIAILSRVCEAKATFGVGDVVITLWLQEKHAEKTGTKRSRGRATQGSLLATWVLGYGSEGVTSP